MDTIHIADRQKRIKFAEDTIGRGEVVESFIIDRGHPGGPEIHSVTSMGIILIHNYYTGRYITMLIARPTQLKKLYATKNKKPPHNLIELAISHTVQRYNSK